MKALLCYDRYFIDTTIWRHDDCQQSLIADSSRRVREGSAVFRSISLSKTLFTGVSKVVMFFDQVML